MGISSDLNIEQGNPNDPRLYRPVLEEYKRNYNQIPTNVVADGCYASHENLNTAKAMGVKRTVFNKPAELTYTAMGVKKKTLRLWKKFRAGVEGNISELKRVFGASKAMWKYEDGFSAFVWSSVLCYNLVRRLRFSSA